jgi:glycogen debranching enzyme
MTQVDLAREKAERILIANGSPIGLLAATKSYQQVWGRDAMIGGLALMLCGDAEGAAIQRRSLATLERFQSRRGNLPHNVGWTGVADPALVAHGGSLDVGTPEPVLVADTTHSGCIDNALWYILGQYYTHHIDGDDERLKASWASLRRAHVWLQYQDVNECGLLEAHEAMDWADLFANRYNTLYANVLWFAAHQAMGAMAERMGEMEAAAEFRADALDVKFKLNTLLWVGPEFSRDMAWVRQHRKEWLYPLEATSTLYVERPYYLPYMGFREWADRFDTFGNLLAIIFGVADERQAARIIDYITSTGLDQPWPIRVLYPVLQPGDKDWREYYRIRNLNLPHHYHNGGAWPMVGGFYVAALVAAGRLEAAARQLERLAEMNRQSRFGGEWEFNEWFHGGSGRPSGFAGQSWSAAMYIYAHECVQRGRVPGFDGERGWR